MYIVARLFFCAIHVFVQIIPGLKQWYKASLAMSTAAPSPVRALRIGVNHRLLQPWTLKTRTAEYKFNVGIIRCGLKPLSWGA